MVNISLLIRADAGIESGTGHAMRCLSLAQEWVDAGGLVVWVAASLPVSLQSRLLQEKIKLHLINKNIASQRDADMTATLARDASCEWVVLDGYHFKSSYQSQVRNKGFKVLVIDDNGETGPWNCDAIVNQNLHAKGVDYSGTPARCQLLLGTSFVLLRREIRAALKSHVPPTDYSQELRLLILMGGSDHGNITSRILERLQTLKVNRKMTVRVILGGANPHRHEVEKVVRQGVFPAEIFHAVEDMAVHYSWANAAVTAAGSTCWELCAFQIPFLSLAVADNQKKIAAELGGGNVDTCLLRLNDWLDNPLLACAVEIDGRGAERVCALITG